MHFKVRGGGSNSKGTCLGVQLPIKKKKMGPFHNNNNILSIFNSKTINWNIHFLDSDSFIWINTDLRLENLFSCEEDF